MVYIPLVFSFVCKKAILVAPVSVFLRVLVLVSFVWRRASDRYLHGSDASTSWHSVPILRHTLPSVVLPIRLYLVQNLPEKSEKKYYIHTKIAIPN